MGPLQNAAPNLPHAQNAAIQNAAYSQNATAHDDAALDICSDNNLGAGGGGMV